ncbi:hypothetical protein LZ32DRAFT_617613 [Colletotrichum eremochloae]|nr:hypothetical protein LZ32DRAFT_617613 [Colletotrichum eremochloae]
MVLITLKHLVFLISLSNATLALQILIGYRRVHKNEALEINRRGNIFRYEEYDSEAVKNGAAQTGSGVYLSMTVDGYEGGPYDWWCWVSANARPLRRAPKVWIPEWYPERNPRPKLLWDKPERDIAATMYWILRLIVQNDPT